MTFLAFLTTLIAGLLIGGAAGAWAATGFKVRKRQAARYYPRDHDGFPYWAGDRKP